MYKRPTTQTTAGTVDKFIGSAYQDLLPIIENLDELLSLQDGVQYSLKYLGASNTIPTQRLDGTAIQDGDFYFDTTDGSESITYFDLDDDTWLPLDPAAIRAYAERAEAAAVGLEDAEVNAAQSANDADLSAQAAATSETNAGVSETNAATSAASALTSKNDAETALTNTQTAKTAAESAASAASISASEAATSETNAGTSATTASTKATEASSHATSAETSATNANTSAINAASSEAAALSAVSQAESSATDAQASEDAAALSATNAETSKNAAASSAASASASATNASNSATSAADSEAVATANANFYGSWADLTGAASIPYSVYHAGGFWMLIDNILDITTAEPGVDAAWVDIGGSGGGGGSTDATRLGGELPAYYLDPDNHNDTTSTNKWTSQVEIDKLAGIEANATADQTGAEIKALYEAELNTNAYTDAEKIEVASSVQSVVAGTNITISGGDLRNPIINLGQIGTDGVTNESTVTGLTLSDAIQNLDTSKIESGENVSVFVNDAGYLTSADLPPSSVVSVDGRSGTVILSDLYAPITHTHVKADISDFNDLDYAPAVHTHSAADIKTWYESNANTNAFTDSEKASVASALQSGDNLSELVNDAGYITLGEVPEGDAGGSYQEISGGGALTVGWFFITDSLTYTLPELSTLSEGTIQILVANGQTPIVNAFGGDTLKLTPTSSDTTITFTGQALVELQYATAHWDLVELSINASENTSVVQISAAQVKSLYESNADTNALTDTLLTTLASVEVGATADQTDAEIKTAYENNADTNVFTDAEKTKLSGIAANATGDMTGAEIKTAYESEANTNAFTDSEQTKLAGIEDNATADMTANEIKIAYESNVDTNAFSDAEKTKVANSIEGVSITNIEVVSDYPGSPANGVLYIKV